MTSEGDRRVFQPLPAQVSYHLAEYHAVLRDLLELTGAEAGEDGGERWHHSARHAISKAVSVRANGSVPEEWFEPLVRAAVLEPDPSFGRQLVGPAMAAFGRRRVKLAILDHLENGTTSDVAGASKAWYHTHFGIRAPGYTGPNDDERCSDLNQRYVHAALRRFVAEDDLDLRRCVLPGLPLHRSHYPAELHDLVDEAVRIARTSDDGYLRHRVEIQVEAD
ncbi:hypothetical protein [Lentzea sp. NPDC003310]|uniref:hypothetical protein n=1 Tax=Lentzea sp. NPDC003310 TaxID=3154447 RepID=UPI0033AD6D41